MYRIKDWDKFFENNKSRLIDRCSFVYMPNKQDGMGLTRILSLQNGAAVYGVWCLIAGACSRQRKPRQGYLTDDGTAEGNPWDARDLADRWRTPIELIEEALRVLSSDRIGWLEQTVLQVPSKCPSSAFERSAKEGKEEKELKELKEGKGIASASPIPPTRFDEGSTPASPEKVRRQRNVSNSDHAKLIDHFKQSWEKLHGVEFVFVGGKDGKHFQRLLDHAKCLERAVEIVDVYLADKSPFVAEKFHPIGLLVSQISTYAAKAASAKPTRKVGEKVVNWS